MAKHNALFANTVALLLLLVAAVPTRAQDVSFTKTFSPATIGPGSVSTLEFIITVDGAAAAGLQNAAFTDALPAGVTIATPSAAATTCTDGQIDAPNGGSTITFSNARVGIGATCTVSVNVTATTPGTYANVSDNLTADAGSFGTADADLIVAIDRPGFTKSFAPNSVALGGRSTLTLTIDNSANPNEATSLAFTDTLPPGMTVADPANASTTCEHPSVPATLTAEAGSDEVSLSFFGFSGFVPTNVCTVTVDVVAGAVGALGNTTSDLAVTVSNSQRSSGKAAAILTVLSSPFAFTKEFKDDPVSAGSVVELAFTITNLDRSATATGITFTDDLAATLTGLSNAGGNQTDVCGAGSSLSGTTLLTLTGGSLAPGATCAFSVSLQVPPLSTGGIYTNTTSDISASVDGGTVVGLPASDNLFVSTAGPVLGKSFVDDPVSPGAPVTLRFTIDNANTSESLTDLAFTDELTTFLPFPVSATLPADGFCGAGAAMSLDVIATDTQALSITGGSLAAGASCSFDVLLDIPPDMPSGTYVNTTSAITGLLGTVPIEGNAASDALMVVAPPVIRKSFEPSVAAPGSEVTLEFTLIHGEEASSPATNIAFTDALSTALVGLAATNTPIVDPCGAGSQFTGTEVLSLTGGSLAVGASCTFSVTLAVPADAPYGTHTNETGNVSATVDGLDVTGKTAEADLLITPLTLTKEFTDDPVLPGGAVTLQFEITNVSATDGATNIVFFDNLNDVLTGLGSTSGTQNNLCGSGSLSGTGQLAFTGGSLGPGESCTLSASLAVPAEAVPNTYVNVTSNLSATVGGATVSVPPASDVLSIQSAPSLVLAKEFTDDPVPPGETVSLAFTISYDGSEGTSATGITFADDLDAMLAGVSAVGLPADDVCGTGSQISGTSLLTLTGGVLASGASCTFEVTLQVPEDVAGSYTNTTSDITARIDGVDELFGDPAADDLTIEAGEGRLGSIGDLVYYDEDGDGTQNEVDLAGIGSVTVRLSAGACPLGATLQTAITDADGLYVFADLPAGDYCVSVDRGTVITTGGAARLTTGNAPLTVVLSDGERFADADFGYRGSPVGIDDEDGVPRAFTLGTNYPNPVSDFTEITFELPERAFARLTLFDLIGRPVRVLTSEDRPAGRYAVRLDVAGLPSGIYVYRLEAGTFVAARAMVVLR